jgi:poly-gamma-glutamate synthesis protein (capsule biosynthesis protein)
LADQGENGIIETRNNLTSLSFDFAGCNDGNVGACSFKELRIKNYELGIAGFSLVYKIPDETEMTSIVTDLASTSDIVIVQMHWGVEYEHKFNPTQQRLAHELIDAGADMIIGHHPHVVQGMEVYKNKPIFYSLGNFIFDQYFSPNTQEELAVKINWQPAKMEIELIPMKSDASQPRLMTTAEKQKFLEKFVGWSEVSEELSEQIKNAKIKIRKFN